MDGVFSRLNSPSGDSVSIGGVPGDRPGRWAGRQLLARPWGGLLDLGRTTLDRAKRKEIYDRVQRLMAEDPITIPLYSPDLLYAMQHGVKGFEPHPTGFYYGLRFASLER